MSIDELSAESHARFRDFRNRLRVLTSIDMDELAAVGVLDNSADWQAFSRDPFRWFVRAGDERVERLWRLIEVRFGASAALSDWLR
jgi:hypothetical protein